MAIQKGACSVLVNRLPTMGGVMDALRLCNACKLPRVRTRQYEERPSHQRGTPKRAAGEWVMAQLFGLSGEQVDGIRPLFPRERG